MENQSKTGQLPKAQETRSDQIAIGFSFDSGWFEKEARVFETNLRAE